MLSEIFCFKNKDPNFKLKKKIDVHRPLCCFIIFYFLYKIEI